MIQNMKEEKEKMVLEHSASVKQHEIVVGQLNDKITEIEAVSHKVTRH